MEILVTYFNIRGDRKDTMQVFNYSERRLKTPLNPLILKE